MAYRVIISPQAQEDVIQNVEYGRRAFGDEKTREWRTGLMRAVKSLATMPYQYPVAYEAVELDIDLRQMIYLSHQLVYRVQENQKLIEIVRLYHTSRAPLTLEELE